MGIIKRGYTFTDKNEDWASRKATAIRLNKLIDESVWNGATNSDGFAPDDGITPNDPTALSYTSGVESIVLSWSWVQNTQPLKTWIYENTTSSLPANPSFYVGQDQRSFFRQNLTAGTTRYYWIKVEARNGRFSNVVGPLAATVATWPVTDTITTNLAKKITRSATQPVSPNDGDVWINTSDNNILYRWNSGTSTWEPYPDKRVDSIADEYVLMVTPTASGPSQRILGFRATNADGGKVISVASRSANVVTITTATAHGYTTGNLVSMTGLGYATTNPNGTYIITSTGSTTFTYNLPSGSSTENYGVTNAYAAKGTEFVVQADYFSIINSDGTAQESPFTVSGGVVYIKDALIQNVSATKITAGTITSQSLNISDGATPGSGVIQSSGFVSGSSGWQIKGSGDAEFNSLTVRNGILNTPRITGVGSNGWIKLDGASLISSTTSDGSDNSIIRVNGGGSDSDTRGGQIDLLGNEYTTVTGYNGSVLLTPGNVTNGTVRLRSKGGNDRLVIKDTGIVEVTPSTAFQVVGTFGNGIIRCYHFGGTPNFEGYVADGTPTTPTAVPSGRITAFKLIGYDGSSWVGNAQIRLRTSEAWTASAHGTEMEFRVTPNGTTGELAALNIANNGSISTWSSVAAGGVISCPSDIYTSGAGATRVGFLNASGSGSGTTYVGLRYDATNNCAELAALSGSVAWRDVHIAPNAYAKFGTYTANSGVTIDGYIEIKDSTGTVRKLAVVS
jgi:hypothetical protein